MSDNINIIEYTKININELLTLYNSVGWVNYTQKPEMLEAAYKNSLKILAAYCDNEIAGIIRILGDGFSLIYIQDIIVLPTYQKRGTGKNC